jgi:hypothetical protein
MAARGTPSVPNRVRCSEFQDRSSTSSTKECKDISQLPQYDACQCAVKFYALPDEYLALSLIVCKLSRERPQSELDDLPEYTNAAESISSSRFGYCAN